MTLSNEQELTKAHDAPAQSRRADRLWRDMFLSWLVCLAPRVLFAALTGLSNSKLYFITEGIKEYPYPLYSFLQPVLWNLSFHEPVVYAGIMLALQAMLGPAIYLICRQSGFPVPVRWLGVLGVSFLPYYIKSSMLNPQLSVTILLMSLWFLLVLKWTEHGYDWKFGFSVAAVSTALILIRPNILSTIFCVLVFCHLTAGSTFSSYKRGQSKGVGKRVIFSGLWILLLLAAAGLVSKLQTGHLNPFPPNIGCNLYIGNNPLTSEYLQRHDYYSLEKTISDAGLAFPWVVDDPDAQDAMLKEKAMAFIAENPALCIKNGFLKILRYWDYRFDDYDLNPLIWNLSYTVPYLVIMTFAIVGAVYLWGRGYGWWL
ncbi:MAG: hypothetical protein GXY83_31645 [Rhodopirellula sp.]|nr:hypothetical protein [Rhodopirellula sp.]